MMHGHEQSDPDVVAGKPANDAASAVEEWVEPRKGTRGNVSTQSTRRTQRRIFRVSQARAHVRCTQSPPPRPQTCAARHSSRWEPYALIGHVRICAGGAG